MEIDFTSWSDAQLDVGLRYADPARAALIRQVQAGRKGSDGSHERVAALLAGNTRGTRAAGRRALRRQR